MYCWGGAVLNLEKSFQDKPALHWALVNGDVTANKLVRVASIATAENQQILLEQVKILSKSALETLVRDQKILQISMPGQTGPTESEERSIRLVGEDVGELRGLLLERSLKLAPAVCARLKGLRDKGIDINQLISELLDQRERSIELEKQTLTAPAKSRYVPRKIKRLIEAEHGVNCAIPGCKRRAEVLHHTRRFALARSHDPHFLAPLCCDHHRIAHAVDARVNRCAGGEGRVSILGSAEGTAGGIPASNFF